MSDQTLILNKQHDLAVGVIKFDFTKIGYPELLTITQEWEKLPEFKQIILRKVSSDNWGIQFVYVIDRKELDGQDLYKHLHQTIFSQATDVKPYATDISLSTQGRRANNRIIKHDSISSDEIKD